MTWWMEETTKILTNPTIFYRKAAKDKALKHFQNYNFPKLKNSTNLLKKKNVSFLILQNIKEPFWKLSSMRILISHQTHNYYQAVIQP